MMKTHPAILACLLAGLANASEVIRIQGSDTMLHLNEQWARAYMQFNRGIQIEVSGGGSGLGLSALKQGAATIAAASRQLKPEEVEELTRLDGRPPMQIEVALDAVAVFVHESNQVSWLSVDQLRRIYLGEISNWKEVGGRDMAIARYSRNKDSGTHAFFTEAVLRGAAFHSSTQLLPSTEAVTAAVSRNLRGIGYGGIGYASGVRSVKIIDEDSGEPVEPSNINVITEMYPLSRPLYFYVLPKAFSPELESFLRWVLSAKGQKIVAEEHYYPLPKSRRQILIPANG